MTTPITQSDFQAQLQIAIESRDAALLSQLENLAEENPKLRAAWEEHLFLQTAISEWKQLPLPELSQSFTDAVYSRLNQTSSDESSSGIQKPVISKSNHNKDLAAAQGRLHFSRLTGVACIGVALLFSLSSFHLFNKDVKNDVATELNRPPSNSEGNPPNVITAKKEPRRHFGSLLQNAGASYGFLAEATADSVKEGTDLLPTVQHLTADLNNHFRWQWNRSASEENAPEDSPLKNRLRKTWNSFLQEPGQG